jgi:hypothetical protein
LENISKVTSGQRRVFFQSKIWETALQCGMEEHAPPTIHILPTIFGERHAPHQMGAATNINQVAVFFRILEAVFLIRDILV